MKNLTQKLLYIVLLSFFMLRPSANAVLCIGVFEREVKSHHGLAPPEIIEIENKILSLLDYGGHFIESPQSFFQDGVREFSWHLHNTQQSKLFEVSKREILSSLSGDVILEMLGASRNGINFEQLRRMLSLKKLTNLLIDWMASNLPNVPSRKDSQHALEIAHLLNKNKSTSPHSLFTWLMGSLRFKNSPDQFQKYLQEIHGVRFAIIDSMIYGKWGKKFWANIFITNEIDLVKNGQSTPSFDIISQARSIETGEIVVPYAHEIKQLDHMPTAPKAFGSAIRSTIKKAKLTHFFVYYPGTNRSISVPTSKVQKRLIIQIPWLSVVTSLVLNGRSVMMTPHGTIITPAGNGVLVHRNLFVDLSQNLSQIKDSNLIRKITITDTNGKPIAILINRQYQGGTTSAKTNVKTEEAWHKEAESFMSEFLPSEVVTSSAWTVRIEDPRLSLEDFFN